MEDFLLTLPKKRKGKNVKTHRESTQKSVSKSPAKPKRQHFCCCTMKRAREMERNMQKRPRETYKIPVKSRSAQRRMRASNGERKTQKRSRKKSHTIKTVRNESKSQEDDAELSNVDHKTSLDKQPLRRRTTMMN